MGQNVHGITMDDAEFSVQNATGDFVEVPGVANFASAGGEATPTITRFYGGQLVLTGSTNPGTVTVDDVAVTPLHPSYRLIKAAVKARGQLVVGLRSDPPVRLLGKLSTRTCAIAMSDGACTFAGLGGIDFTSEQFGHNNVIVIGNAYYAISDFGGSGATAGDIKVDPPPSGDIAAAEFEIIQPQFTFRPIPTKVLSSTTLNVNAPADGAMNGTLTLQLLGDLPDPAVNFAVAA